VGVPPAGSEDDQVTVAHLWHSWLRIDRVLRVMLHTKAPRDGDHRPEPGHERSRNWPPTK
jgi:hypothetical protein